MNHFVLSGIAVAVAVPALIWGWENFQDPKVASLGCIRGAMVQYMREIEQRAPGEAMLAMMDDKMKEEENAFTACRPQVMRWAARDGEAVVQRGVARVMLATYAERTDNELVKQLTQGMIRQLDEADATE